MLTQQSTICRKYHSNTGYLLRNVDAGTQEFAGTGNRVNDGQTRQTDETDRRVAVDDVTSGPHKSIAQMNRTKKDDVMSKNGNDKRCFGVLQNNSGAYGVPETC